MGNIVRELAERQLANSERHGICFLCGGGDAENKINANLVRALHFAKEVGAAICGVVGRNGGYTAQPRWPMLAC